MRILFAVQDPHVPYLFTGGSMDVHHLALTLMSQGHEVAVAAALPGLPESVIVGQFPYRIHQAILRKRLLIYRDTHNGYETFRAGHWLVPRLLEERIATWRPDVIVVHGLNSWDFAVAAVAQGIPVVMRHIDTYGPKMLAEVARTDNAVESLLHNKLFAMMCNSAFVAARAEELLQVTVPVVHPLIRPQDCRCDDVDPKYITFVSPIPLKGLSIVLEVASLLPHREFLFVEGWTRSAAQRKELRRALARMPNIVLWPTSDGLREVFASTAVLLAPSQVEEAFGRVIVEAGLNAIPAVASRIGGIPESIGESGVMLDPADPPQRWADALDRMLSDPPVYASMRAAALANAQREEFTVPVVAARFLEVLDSHVRTAA